MCFFLLLFGASLAAEAFSIGTYNGPPLEYQGWACFLFGWLGFLSNEWNSISWLANLALIGAGINFYKHKFKQCLMNGLTAVVLALFFLLGGSALANEAGHTAEIVHIGIGYFLWLLVMVGLTVYAAAVIRSFGDKIKPE